MQGLTDQEIRELLGRDPESGWRAFVDRYTPVLLALIERAGISDYDEAMELYLRTCERLSADGCARLLRHDPQKGPWSAWLPAVVRNVTVDWVRSRAGRRRLFRAIEALPRLEQQVFEQYYWEGQPPAQIAEVLSSKTGERVTVTEVIDALDAIERVLSDRHRRELLAAAFRARGPVSLENAVDETGFDPLDPSASAESALTRRELAEAFNRALGSMDPEDAAIARLKYVQGLSNRDVQRALHLDRLTEDRLRTIAAGLKRALSKDLALAGTALLGLLGGGAL